MKKDSQKRKSIIKRTVKIAGVFLLIAIPVTLILLSTRKNTGLKTYSHNRCGRDWAVKLPFTIKIPRNWKEAISDKASCCTQYIYSSPDLEFTVTCGDGFGGGGPCDGPKLIQSEFTIDNRKTSGCLRKDGAGKLTLGSTFISPQNNKEEVSPAFLFTAEGKDTPENVQLINEILASFKLSK